jgi:hypothetical protein
MSRWKWILLIFELVLFMVILVLPQVDLPDFAFQCGTAPAALKARSVPTPNQAATPAAVVNSSATFLFELNPEKINIVAPSRAEHRLAISCVLLC